MEHFGIYEGREDIHSALNEGRLVNPYVALVDGELDYNALEPEEPCYLGEWSDDGQGHFTFQITNPDDAAWENGVNIGSLADVYFNGDGPINMDVMIGSDGAYWGIGFLIPGANPGYTFEAGTAETWDCTDVMTDGDSSTASVHVDWDGTDTFELYQMGEDAPALSMDTINPECSE